jgi:DNA-binding beta-propeller fold protein YncE
MVVVFVALVAAVAPAASLAAETYHTVSFGCGGTRGSGQVDGAGNLYVPCNSENGYTRPHIQVWGPDGPRRQVIYTASYATDVAPSPDGAYLYVIERSSQSAKRYDRTATGSYTLDPTWKLADYQQWGLNYRPLGEFLATDAAGNIYFSSGTWSNSPSSVIEYNPSGAFVTQFGAWENSWNSGIFYWMNSGVAVTPDGNSVYVGEVGNNRVQRFDRQADGSFAYAWMIGNDPIVDEDARSGWCGDDVRGGRFAAPYDVGLDASGNIYVLNTSCVQVKKFAPDGLWLHTEQLNGNGGFVHGMAVDRAGRVYLPEIGVIMRPGDAPPAQPAIKWVTDAWVGWAYATARAPATTVPAWKWTPTGWVATTWADHTQTWAQPFAAGWLWAWRNGAWYALQTRNVAQ